MRGVKGEAVRVRMSGVLERTDGDRGGEDAMGGSRGTPDLVLRSARIERNERGDGGRNGATRWMLSSRKLKLY